MSLVQEVPKASPLPPNKSSIQDIAIALDCSPELDGEALLLKTLQTLVTVPRGIKLEMNWKLPPFQLTFTVTEAAGWWEGKDHQQS